jgi:VIT1/CCC1 family predicted Fe2+/Mn2+ transporter
LFWQRYLEPVESLGEVLFGLIMVLTFTLGAALTAGYESGLLLAAVGCNVAWGIIDAVLFVLSTRFERSRRHRLARAVRDAPDGEAALALIRAELDPGLATVTEPADRERLYQGVHDLIRRGSAEPVAFTREEWMAGLSVFVLVAATALPAALPFLVLPDDPQLALRVSNALLVALLFVVGFRWARFVDLAPWKAALLISSLGVALVVVAIALGG